MTTSAVPENTPHRGPGRPFLPGQSGNPAGRPKGSRNKHTLAAEALMPGKLERAGRVVDLGLEENKLQAAALVFRSFLARPRPAGPSFDLPPIDTPADVAPASAAVLAAASSGLLNPTEAFAMHKMVEARAILVGWVPPAPPAAEEPDSVLFLKTVITHTPAGATEPLKLFIPGEIVHRDATGVQIRYTRIDPPTAQEIAEHLARRQAEASRREAAAPAALPAPSSPAPPEPPEPPAAAAGPSPEAEPERCSFSQETASPPRPGSESRGGPGPVPAEPAAPKTPDLIDAERALAKWQAIAADPALAGHKREAARLEILRYQAQITRILAPGGGGAPIRITLTEPGAEPEADAEPDWPPPPRTITIDVPLLWPPEKHRSWLADEGLRVHPTDQILCRHPTREPAIVSVVPKPAASP